MQTNKGRTNSIRQPNASRYERKFNGHGFSCSVFGHRARECMKNYDKVHPWRSYATEYEWNIVCFNYRNKVHIARYFLEQPLRNFRNEIHHSRKRMNQVICYTCHEVGNFSKYCYYYTQSKPQTDSKQKEMKWVYRIKEVKLEFEKTKTEKKVPQQDNIVLTKDEKGKKQENNFSTKDEKFLPQAVVEKVYEVKHLCL